MTIPHLYVFDLSPVYTLEGLSVRHLLPVNAPVYIASGGVEVLSLVGPDGRIRALKDRPTVKRAIRPRNDEQRVLMHFLEDPAIKIVFALGPAGTGKTICSVSAALTSRTKCLYTRNFIPVGSDLGYIPGDVDAKMAPWLMALQDTLETLGYFTIPSEDIECTPITFMRGRSLQNRMVLVDEAQNLSYHELKTILTRLGDGCKIVLMGDYTQCDLRKTDGFAFKAVYNKLIDNDIVAAVELSEVERGDIAALAVERL